MSLWCHNDEKNDFLDKSGFDFIIPAQTNSYSDFIIPALTNSDTDFIIPALTNSYSYSTITAISKAVGCAYFLGNAHAKKIP